MMAWSTSRFLCPGAIGLTSVCGEHDYCYGREDGGMRQTDYNLVFSQQLHLIAKFTPCLSLYPFCQLVKTWGYKAFKEKRPQANGLRLTTAHGSSKIIPQ